MTFLFLLSLGLNFVYLNTWMQKLARLVYFSQNCLRSLSIRDCQTSRFFIFLLFEIQPLEFRPLPIVVGVELGGCEMGAIGRCYAIDIKEIVKTKFDTFPSFGKQPPSFQRLLLLFLFKLNFTKFISFITILLMFSL